MQGKAQLPNKKIFSEYFESPVKFVPLGKSNILNASRQTYN